MYWFICLIHLFVYTHLCIYIYMLMCKYIRTNRYMHAQLHIHIHTYVGADISDMHLGRGACMHRHAEPFESSDGLNCPSIV